MFIGGHVADDAGRRLELVEFLAGLGVDGLEVAFERAVEHHAASRCQSTRPDRELLFHRPDDLAGLAVPGNEVAHVGLAGRRVHRQRGPDIGLARRVAHPEWLIVHADVVGRHVEQAGVRRVGRGLLVFRAERRWADALMVHVLFFSRIFGHDLRPAVGWRRLVHVDAAGPVDLRVEFLGHEQLAAVAIERVAQPIAVEVGEQFAGLTADLLIAQDHFIDAVEVPLVVGRHLIDPLGHAGVGVARKDGHRPFVVTRPLTRIPGRGVARTVVEEVQLRIVGNPTPGAAAADLPLIALPSLDARVLADRLAEVGSLHGVDQDLVIRPSRIGAPDPPAGL